MKIVGNGKAATILIFVFIAILCLLSWRCSHAAEPLHIDLRAGSAFGPGGAGPVLGMDLRFPQSNAVELYAGTLLWGQTRDTQTNWDWHAGFRTCRWRVCASLGASYLQRVDAINGSHTNFALGVSYEIGWKRLNGVDFFHLSNAGTIAPNLGRNAVLASIRLQ